MLYDLLMIFITCEKCWTRRSENWIRETFWIAALIFAVLFAIMCVCLCINLLRYEKKVKWLTTGVLSLMAIESVYNLVIPISQH